MNGTHVALGGVSTTAIAAVLKYLTHWPLTPLDDPTAMAIAGLIVAVLGGGGITYFNFLRNGSGTGNGGEPAPEAQPAGAPAGAQGH